MKECHRVIHVFDFDGTLFRSPVPSDRHPKACDPTFSGGYGWFQSLMSLCPPVVPERPDSSWYSSSTVSAFHQATKEGSPCFVLTGRDEKFRGRIANLLEHASIQPVALFLKPQENSGTVKHKVECFGELVAHYGAVTIRYYEDRPRQGKSIEAAMEQLRYRIVHPLDTDFLVSTTDFPRSLRHMKVPRKMAGGAAEFIFELVMVEPADTLLPLDVEEQLVKNLLQ